MSTVDLNSDLGEGFGQWTLGDDEALLDVVTSANVACGFHASDAAIMRSVCERAVETGVAIGAQVGYQDLAGFGRRFIDMEPHALTQDVVYQIGALDGICRTLGARIAYVKPHGALYNTIAADDDRGRRHARAVLAALGRYDPTLPVVGLAGSVFLDAARNAGQPVVAEAFADRSYNPDGSLVSRSEPNAVLHDPEAVAARVLRLVQTGQVEAIDGSLVNVDAQSICFHGDSQGSIDMARAARDLLESEGVTIAAFAGASR